MSAPIPGEAPRWHDPRLLATRTLDDPADLPRFPTLQAWQARAGALRTQILAAAGLWEDPAARARPAPAAEVFERTDHPDLGYSVEKVHLESLPGYFVTGNLYRPAGAAAAAGPARRPAILNPHGHTRLGRLEHSPLFSTAMRCITFARMGYLAFCHDMAGFGDNTRIPHRWGGPRAWLWGASPLGLQLWNCIRALDFLAALPDADPRRLGCTGESGGGTQTFLLTAVDPRVRAAAPVNMVSAHMQGGCVCENAPGLRLETSNVEIAALCAPRPLLLVAATGDWTVNTPRLEYPAVASVYELYGARDQVETVQFEAPHNYHRQSREAVYAFFARRLPPGAAAADIPSEDGVPGPDAEADLRVFARRPWPAGPEGEAAVEGVLDWFRGRARHALQAPGPGGPRAALLPYLLAVTGVSAVEPAAVQAHAEDDQVWLARRGRRERLLARRGDAGAPVRLRAADGTPWGLWPFGTGEADAPWARGGRAAQVDFFLGYNRADAAWQAQDVLTALAWLGGRAESLEAGRACAVAAVLARAVAGAAVGALEVTLGPEWAPGAGGAEAPWLQGASYLPGVLRAGGLAGLLAMAAPARLRVRTGGAGGPEGFAAVRTAYAALGAEQACVLE